MNKSHDVARAVVTLALTLSLTPVAAIAHDHEVPRSVLRSPGDHQVGKPWGYSWYTSPEDGTGCIGAAIISKPQYRRKAMTWRPQRKIHLRLIKRHRPTRLVIRMYRRLDDNGRVTGRSRRADYRLRPVHLHGRRVFIAGFYGWSKARHLYLKIHAEYEDVERCKSGTQSIDVAFHLRRRPTT